MGSLVQDGRYAFRQLVRNPGFALTAVLSLALGMGAAVAVFSVVYAVLLHPFPYADVDRLANLSARAPGRPISDQFFTGAQLRELRTVRALQSIASWRLDRLAVTAGESPEPINGYYGIGSTFSTFGVPALLGRNLGPSDSPDGQEPQPVVELHYRFWQRHFQGDPGVIGRTLELNQRRYTIVGVTRPNFTLGWGTDVYLPQEIGNPAGGGVIVKLRRGVSLAEADAELQPLLDRFAQENPRMFARGSRVDIRLLTWETTQNLGGTLYLLLGAVGLLLAIGCGNVSILLLARNAARQHEFAVRSAVGASRRRLVRQLFTESLLLALAGTALGVGLAYRLLALIVAWLPRHLFPPDVGIRINLPVLLFGAGLALLSTLLFGLAPALQSGRRAAHPDLQSNTTRAVGSLRAKRFHGGLVAGQIALTLVLLTAAAAAIEGFVRLERVPLGYNPHNVAELGFPLADNAATNWQARLNYYEQLRAGVAAVPGVVTTSIATVSVPPYAGWKQPFEVLGHPAAAAQAQTARVNLVDDGYFRALETPLVEGRLWTRAEVSQGSALVLVNQTFARRYLAEGGVVGRALKIPGFRNDPPKTLTGPHSDGWMQVIGVVGDFVNNGLDQPVEPAIFAPWSAEMFQGMEILVRTHGAPAAAMNSIRREVARVNREQMVILPLPGDLEFALRDEPVWAEGRLIAALFAGFSILALALAAVGLYSVLSYTVAQRTNELGIRMALGASRAHVVRVVTASAGLSVGVGIAIGLALSVGMHRVMAEWVGSTASPPAIAAGVSLLLLLVAAAACLVPARRAMGVDPMTALRRE
ncbi:MAG TPA: ADOP family duplicated permease [Acidobacteriaceae bacterium]|jgi:predicted permease|nr:ADOP family duplicated permease [Acidobacteriaceae bacterium]